jgi:hypothetical protein
MAKQILLGGDGTTGETGATHNSKANSNFDELYAAVAAAQADADSAESAISTHVSANPAHVADNISVTPFGTIGATNVQDALEEIAAETGGSVPNASDTVAGLVELSTPAEDITGSLTTHAVTPAGLHGKVVGVQDLYFQAASMVPRVTAGCSPIAQTEIATSLMNILTLDFNQTTQQYAQFMIVPPRNWNNGTITFVPYWTAASGSGGVVWELSGGAYSNDDALSTAFGTAQTSTDTFITANDQHTGPESSPITLSGTPADADFICLQISRVTGNGSDTLTADAKLLGVSIRFTTDAAKCA